MEYDLLGFQLFSSWCVPSVRVECIVLVIDSNAPRRRGETTEVQMFRLAQAWGSCEPIFLSTRILHMPIMQQEAHLEIGKTLVQLNTHSDHLMAEI